MRLPNWRSALRDYVEDVARKPFRYGTHDCALFVAGAVRAMTGVDHARGWRSQYRSLAKGQKLLAAKGHQDHVALVASLFEEIPVLRAQVGDIAVLDGDGGEALGVVQGPYVWAADPHGLRSVPLIQAKRAFRV